MPLDPHAVAVVQSSLGVVLDEALAHDQGYFLDRGTSLIPTLQQLTAANASASLGPRSGTIAAKANHTAFYIDAVLTHIESSPHLPVDWAGSWAITSVTEPEWREIVDHLQRAHGDLVDRLAVTDGWDERFVRAMVGIVAHTAYHLGEIRQALAVIRPTG